MVVGDDDVDALGLGIFDRLVGADTGIACQHQAHTLSYEPLQSRQVDTVGLSLTVGDVEADHRPEVLQRRDQQRRSRNGGWRSDGDYYC